MREQLVELGFSMVLIFFEVFTGTTFGVFTCTTIEVSAADDVNGCFAAVDFIG